MNCSSTFLISFLFSLLYRLISSQVPNQITINLSSASENSNFLLADSIRISGGKNLKLVLDINKNKTIIFSELSFGGLGTYSGVFEEEVTELENEGVGMCLGKRMRKREKYGLYSNHEATFSSSKCRKYFIQKPLRLEKYHRKIRSHKELSFGVEGISVQNFAFEEIEGREVEKEDDFYGDGLLGMGRGSENKVFSLLDSVGERYLIKKCFSVWKNKVVIGDLTNLTSRLSSFSSQLLYFQNFAVKFNGIHLSSSKPHLQNPISLRSDDIRFYYIDEPLFFDSTQKLLNTDAIFMQFLSENLFVGKCKLKSRGGFRGFFCGEKEYERMVAEDYVVSFVFGGRIVDVKVKELFLREGEEYLFGLVSGERDIIKDWTFGSLFFNDLVRTIFNLEENSIVFVEESAQFRAVKIEGNTMNSYKSLYQKSLEFNSYDWCFTLIIAVNSLGILTMILGIFREKVYSDLKNLKKERKIMGGY